MSHSDVTLILVRVLFHHNFGLPRMWHLQSCSFHFQNVLCPYINMSDSKYCISWLKPFHSSCCHYSHSIRCWKSLMAYHGKKQTKAKFWQILFLSDVMWRQSIYGNFRIPRKVLPNWNDKSWGGSALWRTGRGRNVKNAFPGEKMKQNLKWKYLLFNHFNRMLEFGWVDVIIKI